MAGTAMWIGLISVCVLRPTFAKAIFIKLDENKTVLVG
jgi:hypothetical protein